MRTLRSLFGAALGSAAVLSLALPARAGDFDPQGAFSFDANAVVTLDFTSFTRAPDASAGTASAAPDDTSLAGENVLTVELESEGYPIVLELPATQAEYTLAYWMKGDCTGGFAVDYDDGSVGTVSSAFPTGRVTSDGWVEMKTQPFRVDGTKSGLDARMFLSAYDSTKPTTVLVSAVEVVPAGTFSGPTTCVGLDTAGACKVGELCVSGTCRDARGWFPPIPDDGERAKLIAYWKQKIQHTFGPYGLRKTTMPDSLATIEKMSTATDNVEFWSRFAESIRRLSDAHTYARMTATRDVRSVHPLNACFYEGKADVSQAAAPSSVGLPDILVSHTGPTDTWGLAQGDRLVTVDGEHPLTWAKKLLGPSLWYWQADDPEQIANVLSSLRDLIQRHAATIGVVHCDSTAGTCGTTVTTIDIADLPAQSGDPDLVGCDNRPFFAVDGAPANHDFADALITPALVVQGPVLDSTPAEKIYGVIWNSLLGNGKNQSTDVALLNAVDQFEVSRGVLLDHREGHGGTANTAGIVVEFARTPFTPYINFVRTRAVDEGPADLAAGVALFEHYKTNDDEYGSAEAHTEIPVGMLMTWDVSASDILLQMLKGGPKVKLFGPGPSMGAFGTFMQYSMWGVMRWSLGIEDSIAPDGTTLCTHGVDPDVIVLPKQSDLLAGKDTVHETAMAWIRSELAPP
jgi:hypothetical protein